MESELEPLNGTSRAVVAEAIGRVLLTSGESAVALNVPRASPLSLALSLVWVGFRYRLKTQDGLGVQDSAPWTCRFDVSLSRLTILPLSVAVARFVNGAGLELGLINPTALATTDPRRSRRRLRHRVCHGRRLYARVIGLHQRGTCERPAFPASPDW